MSTSIDHEARGSLVKLGELIVKNSELIGKVQQFSGDQISRTLDAIIKSNATITVCLEEIRARLAKLEEFLVK